MPRNWKKRRKHSPTPNPNVHRAAPPKQRLKKLLDVPREVAVAAESPLIGMPLPGDGAELTLVQFDVAMVARGANALKALRLLCGEGHWEFAAPVVRQLFELLLNLEYIDAQPDRHDAILRYSKFGLLQWLIRQQGTNDYNRKTGRAIDSEEAAWVESMLAKEFAEFRVGKPPGRWAGSWSGKKTWRLSVESPRPIRKDQYELLFREWSEQAHASPGALLAAIFPGSFDPNLIIESDDVRIAETVGTAVGLFVELHGLLPTVPRLPSDRQTEWMERLIAEGQRLGAPPSK